MFVSSSFIPWHWELLDWNRVRVSTADREKNHQSFQYNIKRIFHENSSLQQQQQKQQQKIKQKGFYWFWVLAFKFQFSKKEKSSNNKN